MHFYEIMHNIYTCMFIMYANFKLKKKEIWKYETIVMLYTYLLNLQRIQNNVDMCTVYIEILRVIIILYGSCVNCVIIKFSKITAYLMF